MCLQSNHNNDTAVAKKRNKLREELFSHKDAIQNKIKLTLIYTCFNDLFYPETISNDCDIKAPMIMIPMKISQ